MYNIYNSKKIKLSILGSCNHNSTYLNNNHFILVPEFTYSKNSVQMFWLIFDLSIIFKNVDCKHG